MTFHRLTVWVLMAWVFNLAAWSLPSSSQARMTIRQERELGEKLLLEIRSQVNFVEDQEVVQYVQEAGKKVLAFVSNPIFDYRFFVIKDDGLNAFAMPGGYIFIHSGLLEVIDSDDELICVLAHEIGHIQGRHIARRIDTMKRMNIASMAAVIAGVFLGKGQAGSALIATTSALNASLGLKYSREDEEEADRRAFQWLCKAGYNPVGLVTVLEKMQRMRWLGSDAIPSYLSTHPGTARRIAYIEHLLKENPRCDKPMRRASPTLRRIQVRLSVATKDPYMLIVRYKKVLKDSPGDEYVLYGLSLSYLKAKNYELAIKGLQGLIESHGARKEYLKDLGVAHYAKGDYKAAIEILSDYLNSRPDDLDARLYLGKAFMAADMPVKAAKEIKGVYYALGESPEVAFDLGRAYAALGKDGEAHYYFYQYYRWRGEGDAASYHKRMALKLLPPDSRLRRHIGKGADYEQTREKSIAPVSRSGDSGIHSGSIHQTPHNHLVFAL